MHKEFLCPSKINNVELTYQQKPQESKSISQFGCILNQGNDSQNPS